MNWAAACCTNGCNADEPAAVMLPDTVKSLPLLPVAGPVWPCLGAHPASKIPPSKIPDKTITNFLLPLNNLKTPPKRVVNNYL
jgi:hypothetical protein